MIERARPDTARAEMPSFVLPESEIASICRRYQVSELCIFGSAARGEMRPDSDIDLLVDFFARSAARPPRPLGDDA